MASDSGSTYPDRHRPPSGRSVIVDRTIHRVEISDNASSASGMAAGRLQLEVGTHVLRNALKASSDAALALFTSMPQSVPAGLTFSPGGLSAGSSNRVVATL